MDQRIVIVSLWPVSELLRTCLSQGKSRAIFSVASLAVKSVFPVLSPVTELLRVPYE